VRRATATAAAAFASGLVGLLGACSSTAPSIPDDLSQGQPSERRPPTNGGSSGSSGTVVKEADASVPDSAPACATVAPNNRCGLDPQCGCGANETCDVTNVTSGATSCVTGGGATLGRPCTQTGDCLAGLTCEFGACRPYCKTPRTKCGVAGTDLCVEVLGDDDKPITNKAVCTITCDPRQPQAVCGTNACHWFASYYAPNKVSDCNKGGVTPAYNGVCRGDSDCQPGFVCIDHPSSQIGFECQRWCRIGVAGDCPTSPPNLKCRDVFGADAPVINGEKLGVCQD